MRLKKLLSISWRKINNLVLFLIFFFLFLFVFFIIKIIFSVSTIEISANKDIKGLEALQGQFIFLIFPKESEKRLYDLNSKVKSVHLVKIYPNKIHIDVVYYENVAIFEVDRGYFYLSEDGRILEKKIEQQVSLPRFNRGKSRLDRDKPIIHYYQKFHFGEYNTGDKLQYKDILDSLFFLSKLYYLGIKIISIDIKGLDMLIFNSGDKKYIFTTSKDRELQYQEFKTIIDRFKIEKTEYESIDLRFEKPIIKLR